MAEASWRKDYNNAGHGAFASDEHVVLHSAWFTKKAPSKLAKSKKRWFEMNVDEIRYFSETDASGVGDTAKQKGAIGLFNATRARAVHETLYITNPDREWVLTGANTLQGQQVATAWAAKVNELAQSFDQAGAYVRDVVVNLAAGPAPPEAAGEEFGGFEDEPANPDEAVIYVKTGSGQMITLRDVNLGTLTMTIKCLIQRYEDIPKEEQVLSFEGTELSDYSTALDYGIKPGSTLHLRLAWSEPPNAPLSSTEGGAAEGGKPLPMRSWS